MPSASKYRFSLERRWLTMPDGVRLAATIYMPRAKRDGETFPVLLEILPYRKDDTFYIVDYPSYSYFAQNGIMTVKVDIRGTGGSEGSIPPREYSNIELRDAEEIIAQLAAMPESNGNVAMWGVSWSGFNSLMVAMRRPQALKTIIAMHASDDLFHDDVHYIDGVLHLDPYHLFINHELGLPRTPDYKLDANYFRRRFDRKPWLFTYLGQQADGSFWRWQSLREDYSRINIPVYLVGGLLDGYRSAMVRIGQHLDVPMRVEVGPWDHACPDDGSPGPTHEWHHKAVEWLQYWLCGKKNSVEKEIARGKEMSVFVRAGHKPDAAMLTTPGHWRKIKLPLMHPQKQIFLTSTGQLVWQRRKGFRTKAVQLAYSPGSGVAAGGWWGDATGDMSRDDAQSLTFDSAPLTRHMGIIGFPRVNLEVKSTSKRVNWSVRLEDVAPDGTVSLITGGLLNSSQRKDRLKPSNTVRRRSYAVEVEMHFTTWTFQPGHKVRLAVSNAQFPMAWPSGEAMVSCVLADCKGSLLTLPITSNRNGRRLRLPRPVKKLECPDGENIETKGGLPDLTKHWRYDEADGKTTYVAETNCAYRIKQRRFDLDAVNTYTVIDGKPWQARYEGVTSTSISSAKGTIKLETTMIVQSDKKSFLVTFIRRLSRGGKMVRRKMWKQRFARQFQ